MTRMLLTGNAAAAWGARLAEADYIPAFPITPQTEIIETLARWCGDGSMAARLVMFESEHSMLTAAASAAAAGVRVFTATSSQGLLYGMEMVHAIPGWRVPLVLVNVSRGIASPTTLESDHSDLILARDSGFLQIVCATSQEVLDSILLAYRLAEDGRVRLPTMINMDGFSLSFTREPVELPTMEDVRRFLPPFDPEAASFRASRPTSQAAAVLGGGPYSYFRYQTHLAAMNALQVYDEIEDEFAHLFGRSYGPLQTYRSDDAEMVFFMMGAFATKARDAVDQLRADGQRVGLVRLRLMRPYPVTAIGRALTGARGVAVIDQNLSMGKGGVLHTELASALVGAPYAPPMLVSYIGGLGGRDVTAEEFYEMAAQTQQAIHSGVTPEPRLLYSEAELRQMRNFQSIAAAPQAEVVSR